MFYKCSWSWTVQELGMLTPHTAESQHITLQSSLRICDFTSLDSTNHKSCSNGVLIEKKPTYKWTHAVQICVVQGSVACMCVSLCLSVSLCLCLSLSIYRTSLVAQMAKQETWVQSFGCEDDPLEKGPAICSSILAWRIPWTVHGVAKSRMRLSDFHFQCIFI